MVQLVKMTEEEYSPYLQRSIVNYAESKVKSGNWNPSEAMKLSEKTFQDLLPEGVSTLDHYLFTVVNESDERVGIIWFNVRNLGARTDAFIYEIEIYEEFQRKGYGEQAMLALEHKVKEMNIDKISLHVFGYNKGAISLYNKLGYETTNINMSKNLT